MTHLGTSNTSYGQKKGRESNCQFDSRALKVGNCLDLLGAGGVPHIVGKILELGCLKLAHMTHLGTSNTSYGQKKGQKSNYQFDSRTLKVRNLLDLLAYRWHATCRWKTINKGYNFSSDLISIGGLNKKLWASKVVGVPILRILGLPTWESWDKMTFGCWPRGHA